MIMLFRRLSLLVLLAGCSGSADDRQTVTVLAASSAAVPVGVIARQFELQSGARVRVSTGASGDLARQIAAGAPADVYLSANRQWAEFVRRRNRVQESVDLLAGQLVLAVPRGNPARIHSLADLGADRVALLAVAGENVPAGMYADQVLQKMQLAQLLRERNKLVRGHDARTTLAYIERGEVDAGIVYASDAFVSDRILVVQQIDPQHHAPIRYPAMRLDGPTPNSAADAFFRYLRSPAGTAVFERCGFDPIERSSLDEPAVHGESR